MPLTLPKNSQELDEYLLSLPDRELVQLVNVAEAERCKSDLFYLAKEILGYSDLTESIHRPLCELVQSVNPFIVQTSKRVVQTSKKVSPVEQHADHMAEWFGYVQNPSRSVQSKSNMDISTNMDITQPSSVQSDDYSANEIGGREGGGSSRLDPKQNFIKFSLPSSQSLNKDVIARNEAGKISPKFYLPNSNSINRLKNLELPGDGTVPETVIHFNEEARTRLFLLFRGAFKSTIITIAHTIQLMLIWPDIRILIASHKKEGGSQKFLGSIKDHFIRNERFRKLFPEYCPKPNSSGQIDWGTSEQVTLPNRSAKAIYPEATIEIAGNTTDVTGRHYNYLKIDDIVTRESVTNESMLEKTEEFNALLKFLFDQPEWGISDYAGTCYHFADLYAQLRDSPQITKFILPIWDKNEEPTVPERFTKEGIQQLKDDPSMTSFQFSAQYMMNPVPTEDQTFKPDWWKRNGFYYEKENVPSLLKIAIFVDPANTQKKKSDYTALCVVGLDEHNHYWLLDIVRDKLDVEGRAKLSIDFAKKYDIHKIHYESVGFQNTDGYIIKKLAREEDYYIEIVEMKSNSAAKEDRIMALQPLFERGQIHFPRKYSYYSKYHKKNLDMIDAINKEAWMFPKNEHDDMIDVLSMICRITLYSPAKPVAAVQESLFDQLRQHAIDSKKTKSVFHGFGNRNNLAQRRIPAKRTFF